jgi:hypothetical protein
VKIFHKLDDPDVVLQFSSKRTTMFKVVRLGIICVWKCRESVLSSEFKVQTGASVSKLKQWGDGFT